MHEKAQFCSHVQLWEEWNCLESTSDRQKSGNDLDNWYFAGWKVDRQSKNENGSFLDKGGWVEMGRNAYGN